MKSDKGYYIEGQLTERGAAAAGDPKLAGQIVRIYVLCKTGTAFRVYQGDHEFWNGFACAGDEKDIELLDTGLTDALETARKAQAEAEAKCPAPAGGETELAA